MKKNLDMHWYQTAKEAAELVGISSRRIRQLAAQGRISGAFFHETEGWYIPKIVRVIEGKRGPRFSGYRAKYSS